MRCYVTMMFLNVILVAEWTGLSQWRPLSQSSPGRPLVRHGAILNNISFKLSLLP